MELNVMLDPGAKMPQRAYSNDGGADLFTPVDVVVPGSKALAWVNNLAPVDIGCAVVDTGVHIEIPKGYVGLIKSKSGLMVKDGITVDGTIDAGYVGSIRVKLFNHTSKPREFKAGDKIAQLVILPVATPSFVLTDRLEDTERGEGGFGSTGR